MEVDVYIGSDTDQLGGIYFPLRFLRREPTGAMKASSKLNFSFTIFRELFNTEVRAEATLRTDFSSIADKSRWRSRVSDDFQRVSVQGLSICDAILILPKHQTSGGEFQCDQIGQDCHETVQGIMAPVGLS